MCMTDPYRREGGTVKERVTIDTSRKQIMFKVTRPEQGGGWVIYPDADSFADAELTDSEEGDALKIECVKMSLDELHALPEFMGW